jgi:beta-glucosidase
VIVTEQTDAPPNTDIDTSYRDPSLPIEDRVERLLAQMTVPEKAGLFFHSMISIGPDGELGEGNPAFGIPSPDDLVAGRHINHFNLLGPLLDPTVAASWHNKLQELAASTRLGIPVTMSTDPRHSFTDNPGGSGRDRRRGAGRDVRRHRPSGVRRRRPALRPAPADRSGDRAALGASVCDVR